MVVFILVVILIINGESVMQCLQSHQLVKNKKEQIRRWKGYGGLHISGYFNYQWGISDAMSSITSTCEE